MRTIAIISSKGGTGKTTTAVNLAHGLALLGKNVLLIDSDPQDTVAVMFDINPHSTLCDLLLKKTTSIVNVKERLNVITSGGLKLAEAELKLSGKFSREYRLKKNLSNLDGVDYVICDCAPSINLINTNVLCFCNEVVIPIAMDFLSQIGANQILGVIDDIRKKLNKDLKILGVLPVFYNESRTISLDTVEILKDFFKEKLFKTYIRDDKYLREAPSYMKTIFDYMPDSPGAEDYMKLAREIDSRHI